jgi:molecular chaperone GrpE
MAQWREKTPNDQNQTLNESDINDSERKSETNTEENAGSADNKEMGLEEKVLVLKAELAQAKAKEEEHYNQFLRLQAEFDNYRKRTQKEKAELVKYATEGLVEQLLPVLDNFERAADAAQANPDIAAFSQGVDMIFRQLLTALNKEGLKAIEALGQPFDPNLHEAVLRVESEEHPENTVIEELQKGYYLKEKVLRPCMVKVSN